jgi:flagellar protein FlaJ
MSYSTSLPKHNEKDFSKGLFGKIQSRFKKKDSFNSYLLSGDLFCHITYISSLATSGLSRSLLFDYATRLNLNSTRYFREVHFMAKKLNYDYSEACRIVGAKTKEPEVKALLLRMSGAMASGENEAEFLAREAFVMGEKYGDDYERRVESLKKWTDAFSALILSAALVVVISVVSMLIFPTSPTLIAMLTWLMLMSTALGAWIMYRSAPKEVKTHSYSNTSPLQTMAKKLFKFIILPTVVIISIIGLILKPDMGWIMLSLGTAVLPIGLLAYWDDRQIDKIDNDTASFIRALGGIAKAIGTTVTEALERLDLNSLGSLKKGVKKLISSLRFGIDPNLCWLRFVEDTGSEQVNRSVRIFWDGISIGGDPGQVSNQASMFSMKISLLRGKRKMVASGFSYLCLAMHATLAILLIGIYNVLLNFAGAVKSMADTAEDGVDALTQLPTFAFFSQGSTQLDTLNMMVIAMLIMLTIVNAVAIKVVEGGNNMKLFLYLGITLFITGMSCLIVPNLVSAIFGNIGFFQ